MNCVYNESIEILTKEPSGKMFAEFTMTWEGKEFKHRLAIDDVKSFEERKEIRIKWAREECIKQLLKFKGVKQSHDEEMYG